MSAPEPLKPEAEAKKVVRVLSERATAARAEAVWAKTARPSRGGPRHGARTGTANRNRNRNRSRDETGTGAAGTGTASLPGGATALDPAAQHPGAVLSPSAQDPIRIAQDPSAQDPSAQDPGAGHGGAEPLKTTWSGRAIAALLIPALILLLVWLL